MLVNQFEQLDNFNILKARVVILSTEVLSNLKDRLLHLVGTSHHSLLFFVAHVLLEVRNRFFSLGDLFFLSKLGLINIFRNHVNVRFLFFWLLVRHIVVVMLILTDVFALILDSLVQDEARVKLFASLTVFITIVKVRSIDQLLV